MPELLIFELSSPGRQGFSLPECDVPLKPLEQLLPKKYLPQHPPALPEVSEVDIVRHFVRLSTLNHHVDKGFYPLGSCTMKYNPKINEEIATLSGFRQIHPLQPVETVQGALRLMYELSEYLAGISGLDAVTLQPAAGAHGELTGLMMIRAYHEKKGNPRSKVLIPDSAHGTNPASTTLSGYQTIQIKSNLEGLVDVNELQKAMDEEVACLMLTNPNTLGLFERQVLQIAEIVHQKGGLLYMDGANLNALVGITRPGDFGVDVLHFNLHKTFSTPHGGGGPGSGPVGVKKELKEFMPIPVITEEDERFHLDYHRPHSIGKVQNFYGNFGVMVKAYVYLRMFGAKGLRRVAENSIINANYVMRSLQDWYELPYKQHCKHECVLSGVRQKEKYGVRTLDIAKRLLDFGFHAPTIYFPLIVSEALMIEPTETESKETLDAFIEAMIKIAREAEENPQSLKTAPQYTPVGRLDEVKAAKEQNVRWKGENN
ncbi:MAG: aminomethyl-transferring glycine dehydrogenase subunit GcvPB [Candidatus Edwardsbacteria bacterium]